MTKYQTDPNLQTTYSLTLIAPFITVPVLVASAKIKDQVAQNVHLDL